MQVIQCCDVASCYLKLFRQQVVGVGLQFVQMGLKVTRLDWTGHKDTVVTTT